MCSRALAGLLAGVLCAAVAASGALAQPQRIVVLGSSTAAGTGPTWPDSAWVPRYRSYAMGLDPGHQVVNLALGGYTTYHVLPTGQQPPAGRPAPDPARNITAALALGPDAIVVNLPSNDAAQGYSVEEQLRNYDTLRAVADTVPVWIATPQPRNLGPAGRAVLIAMRDSTLSRYAPLTLDFWTVLARPDGTIEPAYNSGDGIHLNSAGHRILFERAVGARMLGEPPTGPGEGRPAAGTLAVDVLPNPAGPASTMRLVVPRTGPVRVLLRDVTGRLVATLFDGTLTAGTHRLPVSLAGPPAVALLQAFAGRETTGAVVTFR